MDFPKKNPFQQAAIKTDMTKYPLMFQMNYPEFTCSPPQQQHGQKCRLRKKPAGSYEVPVRGPAFHAGMFRLSREQDLNRCSPILNLES